MLRIVHEFVLDCARFLVRDGRKATLAQLAQTINTITNTSTYDPNGGPGVDALVKAAYNYALTNYGKAEAAYIMQAYVEKDGVTPVIP
ncbi:MAG: hypothetical protein NC250_08170 [Alistipes senegalensis]|nr:hypothetical protein [Bacteroides cellulosilyticus]MCM1352691.1 hypothetical protein [Alistipes senegalensis]